MEEPEIRILEIKYYVCGLPVDDGHMHVTVKGAVDCMERQRRKLARESKNGHSAADLPTVNTSA